MLKRKAKTRAITTHSNESQHAVTEWMKNHPAQTTAQSRSLFSSLSSACLSPTVDRDGRNGIPLHCDTASSGNVSKVCADPCSDGETQAKGTVLQLHLRKISL